ncbi:BIG2, partial [Symbiodinium pilosum]
STKQLHLLVYLTVQFAVYGLLERASPPLDSATTKLLLYPTLVVDPPTGVVYNFLRKISTAPFKMLSFAEDGPVPTSGAKDAPQGSAVRSASAPVHPDEEGSPEAPAPVRLKSAPLRSEEAAVAEDQISDGSQSEGGSASPAVPEKFEE